MFQKYRKWVAAAVAIGAIGVSFTFWRASRTVDEIQQQTASRQHFTFRTAVFEKTQRAGFEYLNTPLSYADLASFNGNLYLAGPSGLFAYDTAGNLLHTYKVGIDLPAAPISALTVANVPSPELWLATSGEGLIAFNGTAFRHIRPDSAELRSITSILPLSTGRLAIGTDKAGLFTFDGSNFKPFHDSTSKLNITALAGTDSDLWIGTLDRGVLHWHAGQIDTFSEPEVLSLAVIADTAYIGTAAGVTELQNGRLTRKLADGIFAKSLHATEDKLYIGTMEDGVYEVPRTAQRPRPVQFSGDALPGAVHRIANIAGNTYALTSDALYEVSKSWRAVLKRPESSLTDRNISALSIEENGRLWVGYFDRGLDIVDGSHTTHKDDENVFCVNRVVQDKARNLTLVATANGLVMFDSAAQRRQVIGRTDGLIANHVTDIALTPDGMVAATPAGVTFVDRLGMRSLYAFHGLVNNHVYALGVSDNRVLVGTLGGLSVLESGVVKTNYNMANSGLRQNWITAIAAAGKDWFIGTYGGGVAQFTGTGAFLPFTAIPGQVEVNPNALLVTATHVFAGSLTHGLLVYDRANQRWSSVTAGLPSRNVTALAARGNSIYIGTDNGLLRIEESAL